MTTSGPLGTRMESRIDEGHCAGVPDPIRPAEAAGFADQAVASLRHAISAGWSWPDELKEPDFDALRGRDDFQKLLAELETRNKGKAAKKQAESK